LNFIPSVLRRRIAHRPSLVKIVDNIGWLIFDKLLRLGTGLFIGIWIARYLGPEQFGLLSFAQAFTGLVGAIAALGLPGIVVRDIVRNPDCTRETLGTAAVLQLMGGLVAYLLILVIVGYLRPDDAIARTIVAILGSMMLLEASKVAVFWFESQVQSKYIVWAQNSVFLVFAAVKGALILQQAPLIAFVWVTLAEAVALALMLFGVMSLRGPALSTLRVRVGRAKSLLQDSWPLILSGIAITIYMKTGQVMLGQMHDDEAVGIYSAATRISEVWYFIPTAIAATVFPAILEAKTRSEDQYHVRLQKLYDLMAFISVGVALPMTFLSTIIVTSLYGEAYLGAGPVLAIHIWAAVFVFLGVASNQWFLAENRQILSFQRTALGAVVNVGLNLWWIPLYGAVGAALATVAAQAASSWLFDVMQTETRRMFWMKTKSMNPSRWAKLIPR
jgi:O-antigen/teichoic acid export membrane protein